ncbi:MAG: hypothetical protein Q9163_006123 [Psora crenata]
MPPNASDIITYIGVPLAVLGVLPILYTAINSLITIRRIKRKLRANGFTDAATSGSLMSGVVEVSLPRYSITPLDRQEDAGEYWGLNAHPSTLKGGTWTIFNWNCLRTGSRLYRLQYSDDLQIPQAEIDFGELMGFLLDRGAVPDVKGLRMLRTSGLWTPTGTSLLLSPDTTETVLRVSLPDDSDGILSLSLQWRNAWDKCDPSLLAPGWMRLQIPEPSDEQPIWPEKAPLADAMNRESEKKPPQLKPMSLRFRIGHVGSSLAIMDASWEHEHLPLASAPSLDHLRSSPASTWIPTVALALGLSKSLPLYNYRLEPSIITLAGRDSIPCGVLVMLGLLAESDAPPWETKYDQFEKVKRMSSNAMTRQRAIQAESMMSDQQALIARTSREVAERQRAGEEFLEGVARDRERAIKRKREAVTSPRLEIGAVANAALSWLNARGKVSGTTTTAAAVAEGLLVHMIRKDAKAMLDCSVLERWREWTDRGGMNIEDLEMVQNETTAFCNAACVMFMLKEASTKEESSLALDMRDCVQHWKKVRIG